MMTHPYEFDEPTAVSAKRHCGHYIKAWRKYKKLSVPDLAARIGKNPGVSASMIAQLEQGRAGYTQKTLEQIARGLGIEPWQLLCGRPLEKPGEDNELPTMDRELLYAAFRQSSHGNVYYSFAESDRPLFEKMISINFEAALEAAIQQAKIVFKRPSTEAVKAPYPVD